MRIAIQGEAGSFHEMAARQWFGEAITVIPKDTFPEVFAAIASGEAEGGITAIENSIHGSINSIYDLIERYGYPIIGEVPLKVEQQLIALPGATPDDITHVYSHPVALSQCSAYLDEHFPKAKRIELPDTAGAVRHIKELDDRTNAAIASQAAADLYHLPVLAKNIENDEANYTRFIAIHPDWPVPAGADTAMLSITTSHKPGALAKVLGIFADAGVNLLKLQSRPIVGQPWKYKFYLDVAASGSRLANVACQLHEHDVSVTILGQYKRQWKD